MLAGPPPELRPSLAALAHAVSGLRVLELAHVLTSNDAGGVDVVLHAQSWPRTQARPPASTRYQLGQVRR